MGVLYVFIEKNMDHRHLRYIIKQGEKNMQQLKNEQQTFWNTFDQLWPEKEETKSETCLHDEVDNFIIDKIAEALKESAGNRTHAAQKLGIKRETLLAKMKKYLMK